MGDYAWVTLVTNDDYGLGALILGHTLRHVGTIYELAVLVTPGVSTAMQRKLKTIFNIVEEVDILDSQDETNLRLLKRPELGITFTKLHCWKLTQYAKCVFLDADTLILDNVDELFDREEFSAAPDVGWPDCFNSGVFVYRPSNETFLKLIDFALQIGSFDGGDQGLLNQYFSNWAYDVNSKRLPFIYNMCSTAGYSYLPAFKQFAYQAKIVHFIGNTKPWLFYFDTESQRAVVPYEFMYLEPLIQRWWSIFCFLIHPALTPEMTGLAGMFSKLTFGLPRTTEENMLDDHLRRQSWETGNIDYLGRDSFANIWSKIMQTVEEVPEPVHRTYVPLMPPEEAATADLPGDPPQQEPEEAEPQSQEQKSQEQEKKLEITELKKVEAPKDFDDKPISTSTPTSSDSSELVKSTSDSDSKTSSVTDKYVETAEATIIAVDQGSTSVSEIILEKITEEKSECSKVPLTSHIDTKKIITVQPLSTQSISSSTKEVLPKQAVTKDSSKPLAKTDAGTLLETSATKSQKTVPTKAGTAAPVAPPRKGGSSGGDKKKGGKGKK